MAGIMTYSSASIRVVCCVCVCVSEGERERERGSIREIFEEEGVSAVCRGLGKGIWKQYFKKYFPYRLTKNCNE